jgi:hypothetical protein
VYSFLRREGLDRYDPERFLDYKLACVEQMLQKLPDYAPGKGAAFTTYVYPFMEDALLRCRLNEEAWSLSSLDTYKKVRSMAYLRRNIQNAAETFAEQNSCKLDLAEEYLKIAHGLRNSTPLYVTSQGEDGEETGEDVTCDDHWNYADVLWNGVRAEAVQVAFAQLDLREQTLLERRNAICMTCGRVGPWNERPTFEELATLFEGSSASGAERAYRRAVEHLAMLLADAGIVHAVRVRRKSQKKVKKQIAAAVYEYQADCDGEWGEIQFDFVGGTAEIVRLADWDTTISKVYVQKVIHYILGCDRAALPAEKLLCF